MPDSTAPYEVLSSREQFSGAVIKVVSDDVRMPGGDTAVRDYVVHPGAVGIVALDQQGRVLLLRQYRHPVRQTLWEIPAGLLDVAGEEPLAAAKRELFEEGAYRADRWDLLVDAFTSPGGCDERIRVFLARGMHPVADKDRYHGTDEESDLEVHWVDLNEAATWAMSGRILNAMCSIGVLVASRARDQNWEPLRPADSDWSA
ncbi:MAG: NUDIX hydrolase [Mycobacteriales bacterium]